MEAILLHFEDDAPEAIRLARAADLPRAEIARSPATRDELMLSLPPALPRQVALYRNFARTETRGEQSAQSRHLLELLLLERMASQRGAAHLMLVAPCLGPALCAEHDSPHGEALEGFFAGLFDTVLTIDPAFSAIAARAGRLPVHHAAAPLASLPAGAAAGAVTAPQLLLSRLSKALYNLRLS